MIHDQLAMSELTWMMAKCAAIATRKRISEMIQVTNFGALVCLAMSRYSMRTSPRVQPFEVFGCDGQRRVSAVMLERN